MSHRSFRSLAAGAASLALMASGIAYSGAVPVAPASAEAAECPPGWTADSSRTRMGGPAGALMRELTAEAGAVGTDCVPLKHPETFTQMVAEYGAAAAQKIAPLTAVKPGAYDAALAQTRTLAAQRSTVAGTDGRWRSLGSTPLNANVEGYNEVNTAGWVEVAGRISDFALDPRSNTLYAAVAQGGVWKSTNLGKTWTSIGDKLASQNVGSVAYSRANGGTIVVSTGDNAFCGTCIPGVGVYRSTDGGRSWKRAKGVPSGSLTFKVAVDPMNPKEIYAATGIGLFRSTDTGRSFRNVKLPTTSRRCIGHPYRRNCFFRSVVTDVLVQAPDKFENKGGTVLAAVGWRAGKKKNRPTGKAQAQRNGLYLSRSGKPGSFKYLEAPGFTTPGWRGRIELGAATGRDQNHDYVYAIVQDAKKLNGGAPGIDANDSPQRVPYNTVLEGIYSSNDFGRSWTKMADASQLQEPTTGSALAGGGSALLYAPGVQAWYNEWIQPDPTRTDPATGAPTRLLFGLEEVWQNEATVQPQYGPQKFKVIGRYWDYCLFLLSGAPYCPTDRPEQTSETTTHPDQHAAIFVPDGEGGVTLVAGNDGGVYTQHAPRAGEFTNAEWGEGANDGFNTLLPYDAKMAKDGTVWAGLQDNGTMKITPDGRQIMTYGGDGFFVAVDPDNADVAYEEYVGGAMSVTTDGGKSWRNIDPGLSNPAFSVPFAMDPHDAKHLMIGGRDIAETTFGPQTGESGDWVRVFDLGTREHPGDPDATGSTEDPENRLSAVDLVGNNAYVGYCGYCDAITQGIPFGSGIATNVGGKKPPKKMTSDGWHIAPARGLPDRFITSVEIDQKNPKTVYVTMAGYARRWARPGSVGEIPKNLGRGHVFKSTDAGRTFSNISGNLPGTPFNYVMKRGSQLIAASDFGVFISSDLKGTRWAPLGRGLPRASVSTVSLKPGNKNLLVAATFGRGVWTYRFP